MARRRYEGSDGGRTTRVWTHGKGWGETRGADADAAQSNGRCGACFLLPSGAPLTFLRGAAEGRPGPFRPRLHGAVLLWPDQHAGSFACVPGLVNPFPFHLWAR